MALSRPASFDAEGKVICSIELNPVTRAQTEQKKVRGEPFDKIAGQSSRHPAIQETIF